jgi:hypothetical protein
MTSSAPSDRAWSTFLVLHVEHMEQHGKASCGDGEFGFGLDLILDGLEKILVTS